jgi:hypothetical protein
MYADVYDGISRLRPLVGLGFRVLAADGHNLYQI